MQIVGPSLAREEKIARFKREREIVRRLEELEALRGPAKLPDDDDADPADVPGLDVSFPLACALAPASLASHPCPGDTPFSWLTHCRCRCRTPMFPVAEHRSRGCRAPMPRLRSRRSLRCQTVWLPGTAAEEGSRKPLHHPPAQEDVEREMWMLRIDQAALKALAARGTIQQELGILKHMAQMRAAGGSQGGQQQDERMRQPGRGEEGAPGPPQMMERLGNIADALSGGRRAEVARGVLRPGHQLPAMSLAELGEIEYRWVGPRVILTPFLAPWTGEREAKERLSQGGCGEGGEAEEGRGRASGAESRGEGGKR